LTEPQVAIKLLTPDLTRDETAKQRFLRGPMDLDDAIDSSMLE